MPEAEKIPVGFGCIARVCYLCQRTWQTRHAARLHRMLSFIIRAFSPPLPRVPSVSPQGILCPRPHLLLFVGVSFSLL